MTTEQYQGEIEQPTTAVHPFEGEVDVVAPKEATTTVAAPVQSTDNLAVQFGLGAKHAWDRAAYGLESMLTGSINPEHKAELDANKKYKASTGVAEGLGDLGFNMLGGFTSLPRMFAANTLLGGVNAAGEGDSVTKGATIGALTSLAPKAVGSTLNYFVSPEAKALVKAGVQPSFGQSMGGIANTLEQSLTSLPVVGDIARWARTRPLNEWSSQIVQRATNGAADTLDAANKHASALYNKVVPHLVPTPEAEAGVMQQLTQSVQNPMLLAQDADRLQKLITQRFQNFKSLSGEQIKKLESDLSAMQRKLSGPTASASEDAMGDEIGNVINAFRTGLEPGLPGHLQGVLQEANKLYRSLLPVNKAASARADERIMPRAYQKALAQQNGRMVTMMPDNPLVDNAVKVLPSTVPDSGTVGRVLTAVLAANPGTLPHVLGAAIGSGLGATRAGQRLATGASDLYNKSIVPSALSAIASSLQR